VSARVDVFIGQARIPVEAGMPAENLAPVIKFSRCAAAA
jgi:hypothetical protein